MALRRRVRELSLHRAAQDANFLVEELLGLREAITERIYHYCYAKRLGGTLLCPEEAAAGRGVAWCREAEASDTQARSRRRRRRRPHRHGLRAEGLLADPAHGVLNDSLRLALHAQELRLVRSDELFAVRVEAVGEVVGEGLQAAELVLRRQLEELLQGSAGRRGSAGKESGRGAANRIRRLPEQGKARDKECGQTTKEQAEHPARPAGRRRPHTM